MNLVEVQKELRPLLVERATAVTGVGEHPTLQGCNMVSRRVVECGYVHTQCVLVCARFAPLRVRYNYTENIMVEVALRQEMSIYNQAL